MSVGASSIKRAAKSAGKTEEQGVKAAAKEEAAKTEAKETTVAAPKKKPGRPAKAAEKKEKPAKAAPKKTAKKVVEKSTSSLKMYGIGDKLPIHLM